MKELKDTKEGKGRERKGKEDDEEQKGDNKPKANLCSLVKLPANEEASLEAK